jgi:hypothetical protein
MEQGEINNRPERPYFSEEELGITYGEHETIKVPVNRLAILPQVRNFANPVQEVMKESIRDIGLICLTNDTRTTRGTSEVC